VAADDAAPRRREDGQRDVELLDKCWAARGLVAQPVASRRRDAARGTPNRDVHRLAIGLAMHSPHGNVACPNISIEGDDCASARRDGRGSNRGNYRGVGARLAQHLRAAVALRDLVSTVAPLAALVRGTGRATGRHRRARVGGAELVGEGAIAGAPRARGEGKGAEVPGGAAREVECGAGIVHRGVAVLDAGFCCASAWLREKAALAHDAHACLLVEQAHVDVHIRDDLHLGARGALR